MGMIEDEEAMLLFRGPCRRSHLLAAYDDSVYNDHLCAAVAIAIRTYKSAASRQQEDVAHTVVHCCRPA